MMSKLTHPSTRQKAYLSILIPLGGVIVVGLIAVLFSRMIGCSILLGGLIWFIPHGYVAYHLFHKIETEPKKFVVAFYKSEIAKLTLIALLFILVVKWFPPNIAGLMAGYLCAQMVFWLFNAIGER